MALLVSWNLPKESWSKTDNWAFAQGLRDAISILAGQVIQLRYHRSLRNAKIYTEMQVAEQPFSLPIPLRPVHQQVLDKNAIVQLANSLTLRSKESDICRKIFYQMGDASRQQTRQARELLLSTILEAVLRTLYNQPFEPDKNERTDTFSVKGGLKKFREQYLSDTVELGRKWKKVTKKIAEIHNRLRHRNTHPDWVSSKGGAYSTEELEQTTNDMIFLSCFYGYLIFALSGFKKLEPIFPKPVDEWQPILTIKRFNKKETTSES